MRYLLLFALLLTACAVVPPSPQAPPPRPPELSPWEGMTFGFTLGLLVMGVWWNFMEEPKCRTKNNIIVFDSVSTGESR